MSQLVCDDKATMSTDQQLLEHQQRVTVAYTNQPCRRKLQFINGKFAVQKPQTTTVQKRNERERNRVKLINRTFATLRDRLPTRYNGKKAKKLSKVEVLKTATSYIAYLTRLLESDTGDIGSYNFDQELPKKQKQSAKQQQQQQPQPQVQTDLVQNAPIPPAETSGMCDLSDLLLSDDDEFAQVAAVGASASADIDDSGLFQQLSSETANSSSVSCSPTDLLQQQQQQQQQQLLQQEQLFPNGGYVDYFTMSTPVKHIQQQQQHQQQQQQQQQTVPTYFLVTASASAVDFGSGGGLLDCSGASEVHFLSLTDGIGNTSYMQYL